MPKRAAGLFFQKLFRKASAACKMLLVSRVSKRSHRNDELDNLAAVKALRRKTVPSELLGITLVQKLPKATLCVLREHIEDLVAPSCGEINEGVEKRSVNTVLHQESLDTQIDIGYRLIKAREGLCS